MQGSIHLTRATTASGLDAYALYDQITSVPISFQGSRALRAYGALNGFEYSCRDAEKAYLQSKLERENLPHGKKDTETWVALPKAFWPTKWVELGMRKPMVHLILSLPGHPAAGNRWEARMEEVVKKVGFTRAPGWRGVFRTKAESGKWTK